MLRLRFDLPVGPPVDLHGTLVETGELLEETSGEVEVVEATSWAGVGNGSDLLLSTVRDGDGLSTVGSVVVVLGDGDDHGVVRVVVSTRSGVSVLGEPGSSSGSDSSLLNTGWGGEGGSGEGSDGGNKRGSELHIDERCLGGGGLRGMGLDERRVECLE